MVFFFSYLKNFYLSSTAEGPDSPIKTAKKSNKQKVIYSDDEESNHESNKETETVKKDENNDSENVSNENDTEKLNEIPPKRKTGFIFSLTFFVYLGLCTMMLSSTWICGKETLNQI